jgi:hypothetical protein
VVAAKRWIDDYIDLEQTIADLVDREKALDRELTGLRYSREDAGGIIEDLDPFGWGATCRPLTATPAQGPRQVLPFRRSGSPTD